MVCDGQTERQTDGKREIQRWFPPKKRQNLDIHIRQMIFWIHAIFSELKPVRVFPEPCKEFM